MTARAPIAGVVFDLDGVIIDSEHLWEESWTAYSVSVGHEWSHEDTLTAQGMSTLEWSKYLADRVGRPDDARAVADFCVGFIIARIVEDGEGAPLPGAREMLTVVSARVPIALASSAARRSIDAVLGHHDLGGLFTATVSSEEVPRGKPSPDVYLEAVARLGLTPDRCVGVEDSTNGLLAASAANLVVVALPNPKYPPREAAIETADYVAVDQQDVQDYILSLIGARSI